jgi:hypothetical protein
MVLNLPFMDSNERIPSFGMSETDTLMSSYTANVRWKFVVWNELANIASILELMDARVSLRHFSNSSTTYAASFLLRPRSIKWRSPFKQ